MKLSLQWKWFLGLTGLLALLLLLVTVCIDISLPPYLTQRVQQDLERNCRLVHHLTAPVLAATPLNTNEVNNLAQALGRQTGLRITLITLDGTVVGESGKPPHELAGIENHLYRPEVQDALQRGLGIARRHSDTVQIDLLYVALPALPPGAYAPRGVVRVAVPLTSVAETTSRVRQIVALASLMVCLIDIPFLYWLARRYSEPIDAMRKMAGRVAGGDFSARAPYRLGDELGELGLALNDMAGQLDTRLRELGEEKAGLAAILAGMSEGVLVVDAAGKIRLMNAALRLQFHLTDDALGKTPLEVLRHVDLEQPGARELTFFTPTERTCAINAARLSNGGGMVVVFHDITRLQQLENLRKEFVANVSHELRTPVAVIRGYVETLLEEPAPDAATARQFLATIQKHSRQLEALIEDLLNISALESQQARIEFGPVPVAEVVTGVIDELSQQAHDKSMTVAANLPANLPAARADRGRLHQVFVNLLGNALKYTPAQGRITISARATGSEIECCVADNGPGIAAEHLPRIFERFYRVDKARSREMGGTGLGLSIVKHIVQAHGGRVWAVSEVGQGSRFYFTLPAA